MTNRARAGLVMLLVFQFCISSKEKTAHVSVYMAVPVGDSLLVSNSWIEEAHGVESIWSDVEMKLSNIWTEETSDDEIHSEDLFIEDDSPLNDYRKTHIPPEFVGGKDAMRGYIREKIKQAEHIEKGVVLLLFKVRQTGKIEDIRVVKGVNAALDRFAIKIISEMPKWFPGILDGQPVDCIHGIAIEFGE